MIDLIHEYLTDIMEQMEKMNDTLFSVHTQNNLASIAEINLNDLKRAEDAPVILSSKEWESLLKNKSGIELARILEHVDSIIPSSHTCHTHLRRTDLRTVSWIQRRSEITKK
jgi:hypothetical protein